MDIVQVPDGFRVQLDENDQKILGATWPITKNFIGMMIKVVARILMVFISQGEEKIAPYLARIEAGESTEVVVQDICREFGLSASSISLEGIAPLSQDELYRALGWSETEERPEVDNGKTNH